MLELYSNIVGGNLSLNNLDIHGSEEEVMAFVDKAASGGIAKYVGPFNEIKSILFRNEDRDVSSIIEKSILYEWGDFIPILMDSILKTDDVFETKSCLFSMGSFIPVPRKIRLSPFSDVSFDILKSRFPKWFEINPELVSGQQWERENWGCLGLTSGGIKLKIGCSSSESNSEEICAKYELFSFEPNIYNFIEKIYKLYPNLKFTLSYKDFANGTYGDYCWEFGKLISSNEHREFKG